MAETRNTNILAMPRAHITIVTGNNEDWIDVINYEVDEPDSVTGYKPPLDLRGVSLDMQLRYRPGGTDVILHASTENGWLSIGAPPDIGHMIFFIPAFVMKRQFAGQYLGDVRAFDGRFERIVLTVELTILEGITQIP